MRRTSWALARMSLPPPAIESRAADGAGAEDDDEVDLKVDEAGVGVDGAKVETEGEAVVEAEGAAAAGFDDGVDSSDSVGMFSSLSDSGSGLGAGWSTLSAR